jgi:hypothetical protein
MQFLVSCSKLVACPSPSGLLSFALHLLTHALVQALPIQLTPLPPSVCPCRPHLSLPLDNRYSAPTPCIATPPSDYKDDKVGKVSSRRVWVRVRAATTPILKQFSGNLLGKSSYVGESRAQQLSAIAPHTALQVISQIATYDCAGPCLGHASLITADTLLMHGFTAARALQLVERASAMTGGSL